MKYRKYYVGALLFAVAASLLYVGQAAAQRKHFLGAIPASIEVDEIEKIAVNDMFMASCGAVSYRLSSATSEHLIRNGLDALKQASNGREAGRSRMFGNYSWQASFTNPDQLKALDHFDWSSGFGCGGKDAAALYPTVEQALTTEGSFFVAGNRFMLILMPHRQLGIIAYVRG